MYPILFDLGFIKIYTYGVMVASAFLVGMWLALKEAKRYDFPSQYIQDLIFVLLVCGLIGGRIGYVILNTEHYIEHSFAILKLWEGGMVFYGGLICSIIGCIIYLKQKKIKDTWLIIDMFIPSLALGHAIGRVGCFLAGCCYGKASSIWCAVTFNHPHSLAPQGISLHPTQIYEIIGNIIIFTFLWLKRKKTNFRGELLCLYLISYSILRFIVEYFRGDDRGHVWFLTATQNIAFITLIIGSITLYVANKKNKKPHC